VQLDRPYLLAGEGEYLTIFHHESKEVLCTEKVFDLQAIHGIVCHDISSAEVEQALLLVWGGRSVCVFGIRINPISKDELQISVIKHVQETQLNDWILDGCFRKPLSHDPNSQKSRSDALLVTAHNQLHMLQSSVFKLPESKATQNFYCIASGPRSILYSAHVIWPFNNRVLVAAGTVFGEVLLWSYHVGTVFPDGIGTLYKKFEGHEGSVFGVRISEPQQSDVEDGSGKRLLASCSDDRTIRIWDLAGTSSLPDGKEFSEIDEVSQEARFPIEPNSMTCPGCLAMTMGHASRIWGLRFLGSKDDCWGIISHGEDGTAQVWELNSEALGNRSKQAKSAPTLELEHQAIYSFHSRKNVWGIAEHLELPDVLIVATGGADGRIATYKLKCQGRDSWTSQCNMGGPSRISGLTTQSTLSVPTGQPRTTIGKIFDNFQGQWRLTRSITSHNSNYPSGVLEGTATFESRLPSHEAFSAEYLYSESGDFVTGDGLAIEATRRYVYRYNRNRDNITVWFVKVEDGITVDYFFHGLKFLALDGGRLSRPEDETGIKLLASGHHLCGKDNYVVEYGLVWNGSAPKDWTVRFNVQGPRKNYMTSGIYTSENQRDTPGPTYPKTFATHNVDPFSGLATITEERKDYESFKSTPDSFKTYAWLSGNEFLTSTEQGNLLVGTMTTRRRPEDGSTIIWQHVSQQPLLRSSCLATSIVSLGICCLTGMDGTIFLYDHSSKSMEAIHSLHRKAGFLKAQRLPTKWDKALPTGLDPATFGILTTCLGASDATALILYPGEGSSVMSVRRECHLQLPTNFILASSCFVDKDIVVILGSRSGDLAIYGPFHISLNSAQGKAPNCIEHVHGQDAITAIEVVPNHLYSVSGSYILTAGRNGSYSIHRIYYGAIDDSSLEFSFQTLHKGVPPFGPNIEGICIDADNLYLWGFRSTEFVVWNETEKAEVMAIDCGGAHRNWAYQHHRDGKGGGDFVYTKASVCHAHSQKQAFHQVMQHGGHGREIKALTLSPPIDDAGRELIFLATGAEDTAVRIFDARTTVDETRCLSIITKHTTGLQKLQWSLDGRIVFSSAGSEEFFVWRLEPAPLVTIGAVCEARCPCVTKEANLRVMDFAVLAIKPESTKSKNGNETEPDYLITMVYSDSSIRVFRYFTDTKSFAVLFSGIYTTYCLTQVTYLRSARKLCICTASTDGHIAIWPLPLETDQQNAPHFIPHLISTNPVSAPSAPPTTIIPNTKVRVHQNSIKSMITIPISRYEKLIMTGGDDNAVAFTRLRYHPLEEPLTHSTLLVPRAHASTVTAVAHLGELEAVSERSFVKHRFASVGNDQRLKIWVVTLDLAEEDLGEIRVVRESNVSTSVADANSLDMSVDRSGQRRLYVAGIGMETWKVGDKADMLEPDAGDIKEENEVSLV